MSVYYCIYLVSKLTGVLVVRIGGQESLVQVASVKALTQHGVGECVDVGTLLYQGTHRSESVGQVVVGLSATAS